MKNKKIQKNLIPLILVGIVTATLSTLYHFDVLQTQVAGIGLSSDPTEDEFLTDFCLMHGEFDDNPVGIELKDIKNRELKELCKRLQALKKQIGTLQKKYPGDFYTSDPEKKQEYEHFLYCKSLVSKVPLLGYDIDYPDNDTDPFVGPTYNFNDTNSNLKKFKDQNPTEYEEYQKKMYERRAVITYLEVACGYPKKDSPLSKEDTDTILDPNNLNKCSLVAGDGSETKKAITEYRSRLYYVNYLVEIDPLKTLRAALANAISQRDAAPASQRASYQASVNQKAAILKKAESDPNYQPYLKQLKEARKTLEMVTRPVLDRCGPLAPYFNNPDIVFE